MAGMDSYSKAAMERAMKVQEVILRAMAKKITWWQAAEIIGISDRQMRRWRERLSAYYHFLFSSAVQLVTTFRGRALTSGATLPMNLLPFLGSTSKIV